MSRVVVWVSSYVWKVSWKESPVNVWKWFLGKEFSGLWVMLLHLAIRNGGVIYRAERRIGQDLGDPAKPCSASDVGRKAEAGVLSMSTLWMEDNKNNKDVDPKEVKKTKSCDHHSDDDLSNIDNSEEETHAVLNVLKDDSNDESGNEGGKGGGISSSNEESESEDSEIRRLRKGKGRKIWAELKAEFEKQEAERRRQVKAELAELKEEWEAASRAPDSDSKAGMERYRLALEALEEFEELEREKRGKQKERERKKTEIENRLCLAHCHPDTDTDGTDAANLVEELEAELQEHEMREFQAVFGVLPLEWAEQREDYEPSNSSEGESEAEEAERAESAEKAEKAEGQVSCERCTNLQVPCEVEGNKACKGCIHRKKRCSFVPETTRTLRADLKRRRDESPVASGSGVGGKNSAGQKTKCQKTSLASRASSTSPAPQDNKQLKKLAQKVKALKKQVAQLSQRVRELEKGSSSSEEV
ncbi:hypothetical protein C8J57DRAFT_1253659 [Mycena rebaudengoi]|nr:hypothetical protein C8J57DRAFT_1253659 [Mycena rebaudengoi]